LENEPSGNPVVDSDADPLLRCVHSHEPMTQIFFQGPMLFLKYFRQKIAKLAFLAQTAASFCRFLRKMPIFSPKLAGNNAHNIDPSFWRKYFFCILMKLYARPASSQSGKC
jgi:hypothetical protein